MEAHRRRRVLCSKYKLQHRDTEYFGCAKKEAALDSRLMFDDNFEHDTTAI